MRNVNLKDGNGERIEANGTVRSIQIQQRPGAFSSSPQIRLKYVASFANYYCRSVSSRPRSNLPFRDWQGSLSF